MGLNAISACNGPLSFHTLSRLRSYCINSRNGGNQCQERRGLYLQRHLSEVPETWREHVPIFASRVRKGSASGGGSRLFFGHKGCDKLIFSSGDPIGMRT